MMMMIVMMILMDGVIGNIKMCSIYILIINLSFIFNFSNIGNIYEYIYLYLNNII